MPHALWAAILLAGGYHGDICAQHVHSDCYLDDFSRTNLQTNHQQCPACTGHTLIKIEKGNKLVVKRHHMMCNMMCPIKPSYAHQLIDPKLSTFRNQCSCHFCKGSMQWECTTCHRSPESPKKGGRMMHQNAHPSVLLLLRRVQTAHGTRVQHTVKSQ